MATIDIRPELGSSEDTPIARLERDLVCPFQDNPVVFNTDFIEIKEAVEGSKERAVAAKIVDYIYSALYKRKNGGKVAEVSRDRFDALATTHTFVAVQKGADFTPVVATLRVISGDKDLEFLDLFEMENGEPWPHQLKGIQRIGEIGRLGLHPLLDIARDSATTVELRTEIQAYRIGTFCRLYNYATQVLAEKGAGIPYYILGRNVKPFLRRAGAVDELVEGAVPKQNSVVQEMRETFSGYWHPGEPIRYQPRLYVAPWFLPGKEVESNVRS